MKSSSKSPKWQSRRKMVQRFGAARTCRWWYAHIYSAPLTTRVKRRLRDHTVGKLGANEQALMSLEGKNQHILHGGGFDWTYQMTLYMYFPLQPRDSLPGPCPTDTCGKAHVWCSCPGMRWSNGSQSRRGTLIHWNSGYAALKTKRSTLYRHRNFSRRH